MLTIVAALGLIAPAHAQQQLNVAAGSAADQSYPQWARPYLFSGFGSGLAAASSQQAYTGKFGSGMLGLSVNSYSRDEDAGAASSYLAPSLVSSMAQRQDWYGSSFANPAWRTSVVGTYKTEPNSPFYTTASFGVAGYKPNLSGLGLTNFTTGNEATGMTASAGVGVQVTPNITIEGGFTFTQGPPSGFR